MHPLTSLIKQDMVPALGVTEPGAIAYAAALARNYASGKLKKLTLTLNSGMYKNAYSCGIPNSDFLGNQYAAALGYVAGDADKGLSSLDSITAENNTEAAKLVEQGLISVKMDSISSEIFIEAQVESEEHCSCITIKGSHTNVCRIVQDGSVIFEKENQQQSGEESALIHNYSLHDLLDYIETVPAEEISFVQQAYALNLALFDEGRSSGRCTFLQELLKENGGVLSGDILLSAQLLCAGAIEARVLGLSRPAMSITGSGAHGIICTLPLYAYCSIKKLSDEKLWRATALSYLITMYIKEYSGRLSAFCGCAIAAGTGMACALAWLDGGNEAVISGVIANMASSITGMICDGGNHGCTMKAVTAVDTAFRSLRFAQHGAVISSVHGINGTSPELTMKNMGRIASPGMVATEETIVRIMEEK